MTIQFTHRLHLGQKSFRLFAGIGQGLFRPENIGLQFSSRSSATRAGYSCSYELLSNSEKQIHLYLRNVHFDYLEKIPGLDAYPILFDQFTCDEKYDERYDEDDGRFFLGVVFRNMNVRVPFSGQLFGERGYQHHMGLRPGRDPDEPDETLYVKLEDGLVIAASISDNDDLNKFGWQFQNPFSLPSSWPKQDHSKSAMIKLGNEILNGTRTPKQALCAHPFLGDSNGLFETAVVPALRERFDEVWTQGGALKPSRGTDLDEFESWFGADT